MPEDPSNAPGAPLPQRVLFWRYSRLVALSIGARAIGFAAVVVMARGLGVEMFGEVNYAKAVAGYGLTITIFGLGIYGVRALIHQPEAKGRITSTIIVIRLALGSVAFIGLALISLLPPFRPVALLIILYGATLFTAAISVTWVAQAEQRTDVIGLSNIISQLLFTGQVFLALHLGFGKHAIPVALVLSELAVNIGLIAWMYRHVAPLERPFDFAVCRRFVAESAPIAGAQMLRVLSLSSDLILLGILVSMQDVGAYGAAYRMRVLGVSVVSLYMTVVLPHLTLHGRDSVRRLSEEVVSLLWKMLALALPAAILAMVLSPWILATIFGTEFLSGTMSMRLLIIATLATLVGSHYRPAVLGLGKNRSDLRNVAVGTVAHVGSKLALIPLIGMAGAALGTLVGETVYALASWWTLRRLLVADAAGPADRDNIEGGSGGGPTVGGLGLD